MSLLSPMAIQCLAWLSLAALPGQEELAEVSATSAETPTTLAIPADHPDWWSKVPRGPPAVRLGFFPIPIKTGDEFYSGIDWLRGMERPRQPATAWAPILPGLQPIFELDFRKVEPPGDDRSFPVLDEMKRIPVGDNWLLATGGEMRYRFTNEGNARLRPIDNSYDLYRTRLFADIWYHDTFRIYAEFITAEIWNNDLPPVLPDKDPADFLDLFAEMKLLETNDAPLVVRFGRQELLLGSQRLITTADWSNTRRTFQGARMMHLGDTNSLNMFWVQPVIPDPNGWGWAETSCNFSGIWWTHRPDAEHSVDLYALWYSNTKPFVEQGGTPIPRGNFATLGARATGNDNNWLYDFEAALQQGIIYNGQPLTAGMATVNLGRRFENLPMKPVAWLNYDYASGSETFRTGSSNTFQQLFPFGHYYLGWCDLVGRQNIHDVSQVAYLNPAPWITCMLQHHNFWLATARDALYFANGQPGRLSRNGSAGTYVGNEYNLIFSFHLGPRTDLMSGWSKLYGGDFLRGTGKVSDSSATFVQMSFKF